MKRPRKAGSKAGQTTRHKLATLKRRRNPTPARSPSGNDARETEIAWLICERNELLEQQTATVEVLRVISRSSTDIQPVFEAILERAVRICGAVGGGICRWDGNALHHVAVRWANPAFAEFLMHTPIYPNPRTNVGRMVMTKAVVHVPDLAAELASNQQREPGIVAAVEIGRIRTLLAVPMLKEEGLIGAILLAREEVLPFTNKQIEFMQNFAAHAVIAIENTRLLNELRESLPATLEVLRVISNSPGDLKPVFASMLQHATRLCGANFGILTVCEGDAFRIAEMHNMPSALTERWLREPIIRPGPLAPLSRAAASKDVVHIVDLTQDAAYKERDPPVVFLVDEGDVRGILIVPMLKEGLLIGALSIYRLDINPFTAKQIELVKNFAAQAVIAIENARLLNELRRSLEQQTATADILRVISQSPTDARPVFGSIVATAVRLLGSDQVAVMLRDGDVFSAVAAATPEGPVADARLAKNVPINASANFPSRAILDRQMLHLPDWSLIDLPEFELNRQRRFGIKAALYLPLLRDGECIGLLTLAGKRSNMFGPAEIAQAESFRDQALIAIENTRLFNELRQRTADLTEALDQQTATSDVLRVISSSPGDLEPVFEAMLVNASNLCEAEFGILALKEGEAWRIAAFHNVPSVYSGLRTRDPVI